MPRLLVDYNRCLWYALMRVLELDIKGLANDLGVQRQTIHSWIEGRGWGPRPDSYLKIVELLTGGRGGRRVSQGGYDVLAAETNKDRSTLQVRRNRCRRTTGSWPWRSGTGWGTRSSPTWVVDFDRRLVGLRQGRRNPRARWVKGFGYLSPNPFELWPWPVPDQPVILETEPPSMARFRQEAARNREIERRRTGRTN